LRRHKKGTLLLRIPVPVKANSQAYQIKMQPSPEISCSFVRPTLDNLRYGGVREASTTKTENRQKNILHPRMDEPNGCFRCGYLVNISERLPGVLG
jgi:hypothetical protein